MEFTPQPPKVYPKHGLVILLIKDTATAIGTYAGFQSIATMIASSLAGIIWYQFGAGATFLMAGGITILVIVYFILFVPSVSKINSGLNS